MFRQKKLFLNKKNKGQVSIEYIAIFAVALMMTLPLILIFVVQSENISTDVSTTQGYNAITKIVNSAEEIYFQGEPAQRTLQINFPENVENVTVYETGIEMIITTSKAPLSLYKSSNVPLEGNLSTYRGLHIIILKAEDGRVVVEEK